MAEPAIEYVEVRCTMCGRKLQLSEAHKDFEKAKLGKPVFIVCETCEKRTADEARNKYKY